jgi:hypothetical protein
MEAKAAADAGNGGDNGNGGNGANGNGSPAPAPATFGQWGVKTIGAIATALGLGGSMLVIGSAVLWLRFKEAGMPAIQAVSVQGSHEVIVQGAQMTIIFALIAAGAVAILYVADSHETGAETDKPHEIGWWVGIPLLAFAIGGVVWTLTTNMHFGSKVAAIAAVVFLTVACVWMGLNERKNFWAFAAAVFVSVIVFAGFAHLLIVKDQKFVQAVAVLRDHDDEGVSGFYIGTDSNTLYFAHSNLHVEAVQGREQPKHKPMEKVALGPESTYAIGPLESQADAALRAEAMLERLKDDRAQDPTGLDPAPEAGASGQTSTAGETEKPPSE